MRTVLSLFLLIFVGLGLGFWTQAYTLPRVGLHAMEFGQYFVLFLLVVVGHVLIAVAKAVGGDD